MSDNASTVKILLEFIAETQGADAAQAALDKITATTSEAASAQTELGATVPDTWKAFKKYKDVLQDGDKAIEQNHISNSRLKLLMRVMAKETAPELGEALHAVHMVHALGGVGAVVGLTIAWNIWKQRVEELETALEKFKMPDLTHGLDVARQLATEWKGIAQAVKEANENFDSIEKRFDRNKSQTEKVHDIRKKELDIQEKTALSNLELGKSGMSPEAYALNKANIEQNFARKRFQEDESFESARTAEKLFEARALKQQSSKDALAAAQVKGLPKSEEEYQAQLDALNAKAAAAAEGVKKADEELNKPAGGFMEKFRSVAKFFTGGQYSPVAGPEDIRGEVEANKKEALTIEVNTRKQIRDLEEKHAERVRLQNKAAGEAGEAQTKFREYPGDFQNYHIDRSMRERQFGSETHLNTERVVSDITKSGSNVGTALKGIHDAHMQNYSDLWFELRKQEAILRSLRNNKTPQAYKTPT